jgi:hypothetical protein
MKAKVSGVNHHYISSSREVLITLVCLYVTKTWTISIIIASIVATDCPHPLLISRGITTSPSNSNNKDKEKPPILSKVAGIIVTNSISTGLPCRQCN